MQGDFISFSARTFLNRSKIKTDFSLSVNFVVT